MWQKNVCLVCSVWSTVLMLLNNVLNTVNPKPVCLSKVYLKHLFDVLWEAYLHTEEVLCKAWADQPDFSPTLLQTSKNHARPQQFHTCRKIGALYREYQISWKLPDVFVLFISRCNWVLSLLSVWLNVNGQGLEFGKRSKSTTGNLYFKIKKNSFFKSIRNKSCC